MKAPEGFDSHVDRNNQVMALPTTDAFCTSISGLGEITRDIYMKVYIHPHWFPNIRSLGWKTSGGFVIH